MLAKSMFQQASPLHDLAAAVGISRTWRDVDGLTQTVADEALGAILTALGHDVGSAGQIMASLKEVRAGHAGVPPMIVADVGKAIPLDLPDGPVSVTGEDGRTFGSHLSGALLPPIPQPGYYDLEVKGQTLRLAIAPPRCPLPTGPRPWGTSLQIPSLRGPGPSTFGHFGDLAEAATALARAGARAVAINPVHALFPGAGDDFSPYSPSSRLFLNTAMGDPDLVGLPPLQGGDGPSLIDWPTALPQRLTQLRSAFDALDASWRARIAQETAAEGAALRRHATFDALDRQFRPTGAKGWQDWPAAYRDPHSPEVGRFGQDQAEEVAFHLFLQWLAARGLETAQTRAKAGGMSIGLIGDLAVGVTPGGSDTWAMPNAMLRGLTIGAPPDPLGPLGQNWSITSFSPEGLRATGYTPWIAMVRSAMRASGGLRIDHAFGLARLWVIPDGGTSADGAYLTFPFEDLVRLATLEAHRANCLVIAEDLGTSPHSFTQAISERHVLGMRVLWFERARDYGFIGAQDYPANAVAMTGTHDTQTVAGWWSGRDLDWAAQLGRLPEGMTRLQAEDVRAWDRGLLWSTIGEGDRPDPEETGPVVDAAIAHIARTPAALAIIPLEDLLGDVEQPNLPGTTTGHPNWQRRLEAPLDTLLAAPDVQRRLDIVGSDNGPRD
jgi:4-alpha-glucanotransferase